METILMGHGSGGRMMHTLIKEYFAPAFGIEGVSDSAILEQMNNGKLAFTTDSYVVSPLFYPGGDIGELAVCGTVNDLAVAGAKPMYLSAGFIIEEGFLLEDLRRIVASMARTAKKAGVRIVAGDTKVVNRGKGDGVFINTAGIGLVPEGVELGASRIRPGDSILLSGSIGNHGVAIMAERNGLSFEPPLLSDTAPLNGLVSLLMKKAAHVRVMRDPTRGGLATTLKEFAEESGLCMRIQESKIPVRDGVRGACELLGLDPMYVANEGVIIAVVDPDVSEYCLSEMRAHPYGAGAVLIGHAADEPGGKVLLETAAGGSRLVEMLQGEQLPRIC